MRFFAPALADGERVDVDGLAVRLKVNGRSRRITLRIDPRTGEAVASAPTARRLADAVAFAETRRGWLAARLQARPAAERLADGSRIEVFGEAWTLVPDGRRPRLEGGVLSGCGAGEVDGQLVVRAVKKAALDGFRALCERHCQCLGVATPEISVTDPASRWGSCTPPANGRRGRVRVSWRLALAPFETANYVAAHECCHLIEANHGPRFWTLVRELVGDPAVHRAWLRRHGPGLLAFAQAG